MSTTWRSYRQHVGWRCLSVERRLEISLPWRHFGTTDSIREVANQVCYLDIPGLELAVEPV